MFSLIIQNGCQLSYKLLYNITYIDGYLLRNQAIEVW